MKLNVLMHELILMRDRAAKWAADPLQPAPGKQQHEHERDVLNETLRTLTGLTKRMPVKGGRRNGR